MKKFIRQVYSEAVKQHRNIFHSKLIYFTMIAWPLLQLVSIFLGYKPFFEGEIVIGNIIYTKQTFFLFILTGFIGFNCFWSMVESAWNMSYERTSGTLEIIFLSPCNKLAVLYGRALGTLLENVWIIIVYSFFFIVLNGSLNLMILIKTPIIFLMLIVSAAIWGGLLNAIFLFSRDSTFLFYLLNAPMELFSGVKIPVSVFPFWAKVISTFFPLTYCLIGIRHLLNIELNSQIFMNYIYLILSLGIIVLLTSIIIKLAEKNYRKTGEMSFY
ncbi:ABC transporter permease [Clostridiaceae bacterium M8S5]|nr:ABC transporter permease [Clostridiaceae bacterium M8S5]